ncbi:MAG: apolipoprotein N-acyltransferase [Vicinamibacteria bacterium]|nr:apolipoprotein N-acyltransferase [Vicinamibacteria bacterium]
MTLNRRLLLSALSGILLGLSFPKMSLAPVAFVALVPLLVALSGASPRVGLLCGEVAGAVQGFLLLFWVDEVVSRYGGASPLLALSLTLVLALAFGLFVAAFGAFQAHLGAAFGPRALLLAPFAFVTCEFSREYLLFGFPWCLLGYSQVDFPELIQVASFTAVHGVSFLLVSASAGLGHVLLARSPFERRLGLTLPALLISAALGFGHSQLQRHVAEDGSISVGVIQASIPQDQKWETALLQSNIDRHLALSREAVQRGARLIVWPESAIAYELDLYPEVRDQISALTSTEAVFLLAGNDDRVRDQAGVLRSFVGAKLISPAGDIVMRYHKMRLVPFGEYLPVPALVGDLLPIQRLVDNVSDFTAGKDPTTARAFGTSIGAFICYEAIFPSLVRRFPMNGAQILFNLTNDGWYGTSAAPYQHYAMARFRAVENRRYLVRAANTGISAIIDPFGRELARTELMEQRALVGDVRAISEMTFYARFGDVFAWSVSAVSALGFVVATLFRRGRSNRLAAS